MKRGLAAILLASVFGGAVLVIGAAAEPTDYRHAGMMLLERAVLVAEPPAAGGDDPLDSPASPAPVLLAAAGMKLWGEAGVDAATIGGRFAVGLATAVLVLAGFQLGGWAVGVGAGLCFLLLPGPLYHARTLGPEAAVLLGMALLAWSQTQPSRGAIWGILASGAFALALASAHEAALLAIPMLWSAHFAAPKAHLSPDRPGRANVGPVSPAILVPVLLGPVLLAAAWPFLSEIKHWLAVFYEPFKAPHPPIAMLGDAFDQVTGRAPGVAHGLLDILLRLPLTVGVLATWGGVLVVRAVRVRDRQLARGGFLVGGIATLWLVLALNGGPGYASTDGTALYAPLIALLAGLGVGGLWSSTRAAWQRGRTAAPARRATLVAAGVSALVIGPAVLSLATSWPAEQRTRSALIGGQAGTIALGIETDTDVRVPVGFVDLINRELPPRARLAVEPDDGRHRDLLDRMKRLGLLRGDIESAAPYHATHVLVPRRPGAALYGELLGWLGEPMMSYEENGVQVVGLYAY